MKEVHMDQSNVSKTDMTVTRIYNTYNKKGNLLWAVDSNTGHTLTTKYVKYVQNYKIGDVIYIAEYGDSYPAALHCPVKKDS